MKVSTMARALGLPAGSTKEQVEVRIRALRARENRLVAAAAAPRVPRVPKPEIEEFAPINGALPPPKALTEGEAWEQISRHVCMGRGPTAARG